MFKLSIWIYALAVNAAAFVFSAVGTTFRGALHHHHSVNHTLDVEIPPVTDFVVRQPWKVFFIAIPFLIVAVVLSFWRRTDARHAMVFAGAATLFLVLLASFAAVAVAAVFYYPIFFPD